MQSAVLNSHLLLHLGASIIDHDSDRFGVSTRNAVIGDVDCIGNEPEVVECFYSSIGDHRCIAPITDPDIIISCYGLSECGASVFSSSLVPMLLQMRKGGVRTEK